jgi:hypothetical protein
LGATVGTVRTAITSSFRFPREDVTGMSVSSSSKSSPGMVPRSPNSFDLSAPNQHPGKRFWQQAILYGYQDAWLSNRAATRLAGVVFSNTAKLAWRSTFKLIFFLGLLSDLQNLARSYAHSGTSSVRLRPHAYTSVTMSDLLKPHAYSSAVLFCSRQLGCSHFPLPGRKPQRKSHLGFGACWITPSP